MGRIFTYMSLRILQLAHVMWEWGSAKGSPGRTAIALVPINILRYHLQALTTGLQQFLTRFSGRRRPQSHLLYGWPPWTLIVLVFSSLLSIAGACSSRTTPKPRPPPPTPRPNITFHTYECPPAYSAWYCLNGATCFTVKIGESLLYNCECAEGYMGARCEFKDLDGTYLPSQRRFMLETASIAGGATIAVFLVVILCVVVYINYKRRTKASQVAGSDCVDGRIGGGSLRSQPTFGTRWRTSTTTATTDLTIRVHDRGDHRHTSSASAIISNNKQVELQQITTLLGGSNNQQPSKV